MSEKIVCNYHIEFLKKPHQIRLSGKNTKPIKTANKMKGKTTSFDFFVSKRSGS